MDAIINAATAIGAVGAATAMFALAIEFRGLRRTIEDVGVRMRIECEPTGGFCCHGLGDLEGGFSIHMWQQDRWVLQDDRSSPGYEPSPPTQPGSYDTHKLRTPSVACRSRLK